MYHTQQSQHVYGVKQCRKKLVESQHFGCFGPTVPSTTQTGDNTHIYTEKHWKLILFYLLFLLENEWQAYSKYTTSLEHHTNMLHVTKHQLATHWIHGWVGGKGFDHTTIMDWANVYFGDQHTSQVEPTFFCRVGDLLFNSLIGLCILWRVVTDKSDTQYLIIKVRTSLIPRPFRSKCDTQWVWERD